MPDLTLYRNDIELIRDMLYYAQRFVRDIKQRDRVEKVRDKLLDRLAQNLHPSEEQITLSPEQIA